MALVNYAAVCAALRGSAWEADLGPASGSCRCADQRSPLVFAGSHHKTGTLFLERVRQLERTRSGRMPRREISHGAPFPCRCYSCTPRGPPSPSRGRTGSAACHCSASSLACASTSTCRCRSCGGCGSTRRRRVRRSARRLCTSYASLSTCAYRHTCASRRLGSTARLPSLMSPIPAAATTCTRAKRLRQPRKDLKGVSIQQALRTSDTRTGYSLSVAARSAIRSHSKRKCTCTRRHARALTLRMEATQADFDGTMRALFTFLPRRRAPAGQRRRRQRRGRPDMVAALVRAASKFDVSRHRSDMDDGHLSSLDRKRHLRAALLNESRMALELAQWRASVGYDRALSCSLPAVRIALPSATRGGWGSPAYRGGGGGGGGEKIYSMEWPATSAGDHHLCD